MKTKLTLSLEKEVIEQAKLYAKGTGRSLSEMVENYFKRLIEKQSNKNPKDEYKDIHPNVKKLIGRVKLPENFDEKKVKEEHFKEKYDF